LKNKSAFTMIELVFVLVILGILASLAMGRMDRDLRQEATETILSHIRLTQQLALRDNKHRSDNNANWQKAYWQIDFDCTTYATCRYVVGSDTDLGGTIVKSEAAVDPTDGKYLLNDNSGDTEMSDKVLLEHKFGIHNFVSSGGCANSDSIAFDYVGRPYINNSTSSNDFSNIMTTDCNLTFTMSTDQDDNGIDDTFTITVEAETGNTFIVGYKEL